MKKQKKSTQFRPKLTLSIDSTVVEKAKEYAESKGKSLSYLVEEYFLGLVQEREAEYRSSISELNELRALVKGKIPKGLDYKEEIREIKMSKLNNVN